MVGMNDTKERLKENVNSIPAASGVYLMRDERRGIVYVGKSKNLRTRVRSYFAGRDSRKMIPFLLSRVHSIDVIVTENEKEALILENELIKKNRPRYNVTLRDDKTYFSIRIDLGEPFPRFQLVRRVRKDGATYFGPYASSGAVKETLDFLQKVFPLRTCKDNQFRNRGRPCMEFEIKRCLAPCCRFVSERDYKAVVREAVLFIGGRGTRLLSELKARMQDASDAMNFEEAAEIRDRIRAIEVTLEKQTMVSQSMTDRDVFGLFRDGEHVRICLLYVRNGAITGKKDFPLIKTGAGSTEVVSSVLKQYYDREVFIPREIVIPEQVEDRSVIEEWLMEKRKGRRVSIIVPRKGERKRILTMADSNAKTAYLAEKASSFEEEQTLRAMMERLHLRAMPRRIECFDISNIGGRSAVGSMVTFIDGRPDTAGYRRFRIKTVDGADDYAMMSEVLGRRYRHKKDVPDLIVVDGGRGQLGVARSVLKDLDISEADVIAVAKETRSVPGPAGGREGRKEDRVYIPNRKNPIYLMGAPPVLFLLQRIRDEAHRFAVTYYRRLKERREFISQVEEIPGIGGGRKKELLRHFGDVEKIREATREELEAVPGIGRETARRIFEFFRKDMNRGN
jgi:excinuclease ABC subunit C